ncbi:MAG: hypothetical protein FWD57_06155 [Polyangiaceae bacterium]|nr:hypothetical protein [Polyangiaceae bacterium]
MDGTVRAGLKPARIIAAPVATRTIAAPVATRTIAAFAIGSDLTLETVA